MTVVNYIILRTSVEQDAWEDQAPTPPAERTFCGKKFKIINGGLKEVHTKLGAEEPTVNGELSIVIGSVFTRYEFNIKTQYAPPTNEANDHFGSFYDLKALFMLNSPNGTPSNKITLVDNYGTEKTVYMRKEFSPNPITTIIDGEAYVFTTVYLFLKDATA